MHEQKYDLNHFFSKQYYNDVMDWVEYFGAYKKHDHIMYSRNADTWGFSNVEIEYETI